MVSSHLRCSIVVAVTGFITMTARSQYFHHQTPDFQYEFSTTKEPVNSNGRLLQLSPTFQRAFFRPVDEGRFHDLPLFDKFNNGGDGLFVPVNSGQCGVNPPGCLKSRYRTFDGSCNNLDHPSWGTPNTTYARLLPAIYGDGVSSPTEGKAGRLPEARIVSLTVFPDRKVDDPKWTLLAMQYGQIITHDMSLLTGNMQSSKYWTQCCGANGRFVENSRSLDNHCYPIVYPVDDPTHGPRRTQCANFVRTITDKDRNCEVKDGRAEQLTAVTSYLDLSIVYGSSTELNIQLREFNGGRLRVEIRHGKHWPPSAPNKTAVCDVSTEAETCYLAGDIRVNQNPQLTTLHIIWLREHNRVANILAHLNPHWNDETLFQEARRITIAEHQNIVYYEWLPAFLGKDNILQHKIIFETKEFVDDYNPHVNPAVLNEHANAAFRYFHSAIAGHLQLISEHRHIHGALRLSDWFNRPEVLEQGENFDFLIRGFGTQPEERNDRYFTSEITQFLFRGNQPAGGDLRAIDIQRNRDHGLATYNDARELCGLPRAHSFHDFADLISPEDIERLALVYSSPDDVDLTVGGSLERHSLNAESGPTFQCIMTEQFYRTRVADRFFFEHGHDGEPFTLDQLNELRKASISRVLCDNGDHISEMQPLGFARVSPKNPIRHCEELPFVDLSLWQDFSRPHQPQHQHGFFFNRK